MLLTAWPSWKQLPLEADAVLSKPAEATAIVRAVDKLTSNRTRGADCSPARARRPPKMAWRPDAAPTRQFVRGRR
jgi:hypothetical protein